MILGIDEVGRGPWAGPLVVGAVVLGDADIDGLDDSKKLTKKRREALNTEIREKVAAWALGWVSARELDDVGMSQALQLATRRAVKQIQTICREKGLHFDEIIIDGMVNFLAGTALEKYVTVMAKADGLIPSVSAASIIAKVARDQFMAEQDTIYPGYGFASNAGYGVARHREAIERLGVTPLHRLSFAPLAKYADNEVKLQAASRKNPKHKPTTTRQIGDASEAVAAEELMRRGHRIIDRNWRTRWCEVDIISMKDDIIYFTEVKHRKNNQAGDGIAAITSHKLHKMKLAVKLYSSRKPGDYRLLAIATTGSPPHVINIVEI